MQLVGNSCIKLEGLEVHGAVTSSATLYCGNVVEDQVSILSLAHGNTIINTFASGCKSQRHHCALSVAQAASWRLNGNRRLEKPLAFVTATQNESSCRRGQRCMCSQSALGRSVLPGKLIDLLRAFPFILLQLDNIGARSGVPQCTHIRRHGS